jgi:hypothetical protein
MGYLKPLPKRVPRGQRFGENPGLGPNPAGGHNGDDYKSWVGEPIYAAGDGEVIHAGQFDSTYADNFGWNLNYGGNMVVLNLDGDAGPYVEYGHMDKIYVSAGQRVRRGQVIGTTGATDGGTGVITGPHLHVGCLPPNFNLNTNTYGRVNPDLYLTDYPDDAGTISAQSATITPIQEEEEDMALSDDDLRKVYEAVWFGTPGARLVPNEAGGNGEWPFTTLGSMTARIGRDIVLPQLAELKRAAGSQPVVDAGAVADAVIAQVGADLAKSVADELGKRIAK